MPYSRAAERWALGQHLQAESHPCCASCCFPPREWLQRLTGRAGGAPAPPTAQCPDPWCWQPPCGFCQWSSCSCIFPELHPPQCCHGSWLKERPKMDTAEVFSCCWKSTRCCELPVCDKLTLSRSFHNHCYSEPPPRAPSSAWPI